MNTLKLVNKLGKRPKLLASKAYNCMIKTPLLRKHLPLSFITIETTTFCNLRCQGCYRTSHEYHSKNENMPLADFKLYVDQLPTSITISLNGFGEPTINKDLVEMTKYACNTKKFSRVIFTSNLLAKDTAIYDTLFSNGLTELFVSVDSLDQEEVEKLRPGTDVKLLEENLKSLLEKFADKITIIMVVSNTNISTFQGTVKRLAKLGAKLFRFQPLEDQGESSNCLSGEGRKEYLKVVGQFEAEGLNVISSQNFKVVKGPCYNLYFAPAITVDGYLTSCCRQLNKDVHSFGSLKEKPFKELYYSKQVDQMQENMAKGVYPSFCKGCDLNHSD
jgi:MoaA/NifB/PqqE/SkfB family radical SAM enzyme